MILEKTYSTPKVIIDKKKFEIHFEGASFPDNSNDFYSPIRKELKSFFENFKKENIKIICKFTLLNSTSTKYIFDILNIANEFSVLSKNINVDWYYEEDDEDMGLDGYTFKETFINIDFKMIKVKDLDMT